MGVAEVLSAACFCVVENNASGVAKATQTASTAMAERCVTLEQ